MADSLPLAMATTAGDEVHGVGLDAQTRCIHYFSALDVIAIRMMCCNRFYACKDCHNSLEDHAIEVWPRECWSEPAVLCGVCRSKMTILEYTSSGNVCPGCEAGFNPGCRTHYHFYFGR